MYTDSSNVRIGCLATNMKSIFKSKPKTPAEIVCRTRDLLVFLNTNSSSTTFREAKREEKLLELSQHIRELKRILYGSTESEPVPEACAQLTKEFFKKNTQLLRLLIIFIPKLNLRACKDVTQVVANLQRQQVQSRLIASDYLDANKDLIDVLISGYEEEDSVLALAYGSMLRECIRHQSIARYVLESKHHMKKFFGFMNLPNFEIASDVSSTFKELMTRHKSTVAEFLTKNHDWFFIEYNSKLLENPNYITRRQAVTLLGEVLCDRTNSAVMMRYVSSMDNLRIIMNLLRETSSKNIQLEAFRVFSLFVVNPNMPSDVLGILVVNSNKLVRLFGGFNTDKEDKQFDADKAHILEIIAALEPKDHY
ncbi:hypothetical protein IFM89_006146 [Coptis chinensis]|uniref:MO25-like protein n=1 Tax=Coptis chinensis TaxID=261450 RepID=A0A835GXV5_9MAGN|nr:hypothetical protein IFM89_006146 [Coptis chinensis]